MNLIDRFCIVDVNGDRFVILWAPIVDGQATELNVYGKAKTYKEAIDVLKAAAQALPRPCVIECYAFAVQGTVSRDGVATFQTCYGVVREEYPAPPRESQQPS